MPSPDPGSTSLPPLSRLHAALDALRRHGQSRAILELVRAWPQAEAPSDHAALREVEALLDLGQVERAWSRLQPLLGSESPKAQVFELAAEVLLARGWHDRARELLQRALAVFPDQASLQRAWDRAAGDVEPLPQVPGPGQAVSTAEHLDLAELLLRRGQVLSARSLLDRLARSEPDSERVQDLRWALAPGPPTVDPIEDLIARALPSSSAASSDDEPELTDAITQERPGAGLPPETRSAATFPSLFRLQSADTDLTDAGPERTAPSGLDFVDLPEAFDERPTEIDAGGDTRVLRVIDLKGVPSSPELRPSLTPDLPGDGAFDAALEDEDDDLVVLTHRAWPSTSAAPSFDQDPSLSEVGREVAHLLREPRARSTPVRPEPAADASDPGTDEIELTPIDEGIDTDAPAPAARAGRARRKSTYPLAWLAVLALVVAMGGAVVAALLLLLVLGG